MGDEAAPLIVSALFGADDFAWLDALRRAHFPPERNHLAAHLTLFHHLPPSVEAETRRRLAGLTRGMPTPRAQAAGIQNLGGGTAIRIVSPALEAMRAELAEAFTGLLTPQDRAGWRPHVTVQNKVAADEARRLQRSLEADFVARPVAIAGLALWRYRGGPWEPVSRHMFTAG
ncbi:2'-5' RNA ligase family protein [Sphingomonas nostoxanthinifaciens]|uniref:2'-5' RNA ligase family protein n=1 Tax=Sphingomonas nostoxanthinifaciens TaxID=2872652 RepID=UPI001CC20154|nr:2'-5' RNA ligase family protein [Sphingomonas nostoxanthinifaciens]